MKLRDPATYKHVGSHNGQAHSNDMRSQSEFVEDFDEAKEESAAQHSEGPHLNGSSKAGDTPAGPVDEALAEKDAVIRKLNATNEVSGVLRTTVRSLCLHLIN